jgi:hypothetical protein
MLKYYLVAALLMKNSNQNKFILKKLSVTLFKGYEDAILSKK